MEIRPILASLNKHRIPALLIILEIALACAVLCNAIFMISRRIEAMTLPNAIDEHGVVIAGVEGADRRMMASDVPRNLAALRSIAGVKSAALMFTVPLTQNSLSWSFGLTPGVGISNQQDTDIMLYLVGEHSDQALGLQLMQGRFFNASEYADSTLGSAALPSTHVVVVTNTLAKKLWPGQPALGKVIYSKNNNYTVIGVVADVLRPSISTINIPKSYFAGFFPVNADPALNDYVLRTEPADRERVMNEAKERLQALNPQAVVKTKSFDDIRRKFYANAQSMVWILVLVSAVMLAVTAFGIIGLTSFWVGQRRRQIGIRRAVGATRGDILRYFRTENFLLSTAGVTIGMLLAFGINLYLMKQYELARMPWYYLPCGAVALWLVGQLAVLPPALRAAAVPPVVATRSV